MPVQIESTSDTPEQVLAAMGGAESTEVAEEVEQKTAPESENSEGESEVVETTPDDSDTSTETEESKDSEDDNKEGEEKPSEETHEKSAKGNRVQKRINKLTSKLSDKDQEIEFLRDQLKSRSEYLREESKDEPAQIQQQDDGRPQMPSEFDFDTEADFMLAQNKYLEDLTDWKVEQRFQAKADEARQNEVKTVFEEKQARHNERIEEFKKTHTDFDDIVKDAKDWARPTVALETLVLDSDYSAELAYELLADEELFESINSLSPLQMGRAIGKLETTLVGAPSVETKKLKTTQAPAPVKPVGGKSARANVKSIHEPGLDFDEYKRRKLKQSNITY